MSFSTAKKVGVGLLLCAAVVIAVGMLVFSEGEIGYLLAEYCGIALIPGGAAVIAIWARCPHCGRHIIRNLLKLKVCPFCGKELDAGRRG